MGRIPTPWAHSHRAHTEQAPSDWAGSGQSLTPPPESWWEPRPPLTAFKEQTEDSRPSCLSTALGTNCHRSVTAAKNYGSFCGSMKAFTNSQQGVRG